MNPDVISAISVAAQTIIAGASLLIAWVIWRDSRREKKAEASRIIQDVWNVVNTMAITNDEILEEVDKMFAPAFASQSIEVKRKRWIAFCVLNALQITYLEEVYDILDEEYASQSLKQLLPVLLQDDDIYYLTQNRGYHPRFSLYCKQIRSNLKLRRPQISIEVNKEKNLNDNLLRNLLNIQEK
jgi:hypothetical protein